MFAKFGVLLTKSLEASKFFQKLSVTLTSWNLFENVESNPIL